MRRPEQQKRALCFPCRQSSVAGFATQLFSFRRCPNFLVGEVTPNECDWEQPGVAHGILPADLTHVSRHVSCVAPCLNTRLGNRRHDVIKFPAPKRASYLQASATVEASAFIFLLPQQFAGTCRDAGFAALPPRDVFAEVARAARRLLLRRARMNFLHRRRFSSALEHDSNLAEGSLNSPGCA